MFATGFYLEREPLTLGQLPASFIAWVQLVGALSAIGAAIFCVSFYVQERGKRTRTKLNPFFGGLVGVALLLYLAVGLLYLASGIGIGVDDLLPSGNPSRPASVGGIMLNLAGGLSILAVVCPILVAAVTRLRWGRIRALAHLSLKEALRSRVVLIFSLMGLIFLFADWFVPYTLPEDQLRNYVGVVYLSLAVIFLVTASLLGAFGIPTDIKNQSVHTIVTKPVEKFELVLGRFLGYGTLLTVGLAVLAGLSLLYIARGVNEKAREESFKARVPIYGELSFSGTKDRERGESVGRQWDYRSYIGGPDPRNPDAPKKYAIWSFDQLPFELGERQTWIPFEYTFDIYRMQKAKLEEEGEAGIFCTFTFADGRMPLDHQFDQLLQRVRRERDQRNAVVRKEVTDPAALEKRYDEVERQLAYEFGVYEKAGKGVIDYHTQELRVPPELFKKLNELETRSPREALSGGGRRPMLTVFVSVDRVSAAQLLGVARRDFYLLAAVHPFWPNFLKGILGMWFTFMLVLGMAITCSTYLSGVISWLCTIFVFLPGLFVGYIRDLAEKRTEGGGPFESLYRIVRGVGDMAPLDASTGTTILKSSDDVYLWWLRIFLNLIPDVSRYYDLNNYVANGFDIPWTGVLLLDNLLPLLAYLVPCGVLAYYLMRFREIANPT